jgi:L-fuconolactonase
MPAFPIIDAHLHLWDPARIRIPWQAGNEAMQRPFGLADYRAATAGIDIEAMVFAECFVDAGEMLNEVAYVEENAEKDTRIKAIIAQAPLELGDDVRPYLAHLVARHPTVTGIRRLIEGQPDPDFARRPGFRAGVQALKDFGLSFDVNVVAAQMDQAVELAQAVAGVTLILDHAGKPPIRDGALRPWADRLREFASVPGTYCKLSDLPVEADRARWTYDDLAPYIETVVEAFGFPRLIFGLDWPVCTQATTPQRWLEVLDRALAGAGEEALRAYYAENARRVYRLDGPNRR